MTILTRLKGHCRSADAAALQLIQRQLMTLDHPTHLRSTDPLASTVDKVFLDGESIGAICIEFNIDEGWVVVMPNRNENMPMCLSGDMAERLLMQETRKGIVTVEWKK